MLYLFSYLVLENMDDKEKRLFKKAKEILNNNGREIRTVSSTNFYLQQWSWDSAQHKNYNENYPI